MFTRKLKARHKLSNVSSNYPQLTVILASRDIKTNLCDKGQKLKPRMPEGQNSSPMKAGAYNGQDMTCSRDLEKGRKCRKETKRIL